jgi:uncharacterized protein (DUF608 family)
MKKDRFSASSTFTVLIIALLATAAPCMGKEKARDYNEPYSGKNLARIAFPIGGMGAGMLCMEGTGAISHLSLRHLPEMFHEPCTFAAIHVKGAANGTKVLEGNVPEWKKFGMYDSGLGGGGHAWGLPRFENAVFTARFPFAEIAMTDKDIPLAVKLTGWSPFIPTDEDNSGLPAGALEYTFTNTGTQAVDAIFSFNTRNFMYRTNKVPSPILEMDNGFILSQNAPEDEPHLEGYFAAYTDDPATRVNYCWFRGNWFDPLTMAWNDIQEGIVRENKPGDMGPGASIFVPVKLGKGESRTVRLMFAWYVPRSNINFGPDAETDNDRGDHYSPDDYADTPRFYEPWYSRRFADIGEVVDYWKTNYDDLRAKTSLFTETFYSGTLPSEVIEAVAANLTILKSPTVMRQHDGRMWNWEGCGDSWGSCHGSCTHVWNYAQAISHLFPSMERTLRETEYFVGQNRDGHQVFRNNLPIRPVKHDFHAAADGQLGGIMKVYRDWRIFGDNAWAEKFYPQMVKSIEYCIRTWDPRETGALEEPHHNTYDIEFWGPDGMCTSFYAAALNVMVRMGKELGKDVGRYETLLAKSVDYMENRLFDGEYFFQNVRWRDLDAPDPTEAVSFHSTYSPEARAVLMNEGPKYQYGTGCISDGVLGSWMSLTAGLPDPLDPEKVRSHLLAVHKYNLKSDLSDHSNPQRPTYALGNDGGLLLCSWPKGGKPQLPFVYSDEVWTGIEYQVASHLIMMGEVEKGLEVVRLCRDRYDGTVRNPFNEYECGHWYARALSSYGLLQAFTGIRYDAVEKALIIAPRIDGDFTSFISTDTGFGVAGIRKGKPFMDVKYGTISVERIILNDH